MSDSWPPLPPAPDWAETRETVHRWSQIVGKVRLAHAPLVNHWWNVPLYVTERGLTTSLVPHARRPFRIDLDLVGHRLVVATDEGDASLDLRAASVAGVYGWLLATLADAGAETQIWPMPVEIPGDVARFPDDDRAAYDADVVERYGQALRDVDRVLGVFRSRFVGKCSPVHFFWGAFDHAVTRFSGRTAPRHPGGAPHLGDWVMHEAYSHEVSSAGFWPGDGLGEAAFYSYAYPEPPGFRDASVQPAAARYADDLGEFVLPYEAVRQSEDPDATLLSFLESTYGAAADGADWDRDALERKD